MATPGNPGIAPTITSLCSKAQMLSDTWGLSDQSSEMWLSDVQYAFDSQYLEADQPRSWSNWLVPGRLMLGQYPHCQPARPGPTLEDARNHLRRVIEAGVDGFASLQAELPPQDDSASWPTCGVYLEEGRSQWPDPFVQYAADAISAAEANGLSDPLKFFHYGIEDLWVPDDESKLLNALDAFLSHYSNGGRALYLHCWGGRGRAGLVGACLLSLLCPHLDGESVLDIVQQAYSARAGAANMPAALKRSPQTELQRDFVRRFVQNVRAARDR